MKASPATLSAVAVSMLLAAADVTAEGPSRSVSQPGLDPQLAALGLQEDSRPSRDYPGWRRPERILIGSRGRTRISELQQVAPGVEFVVVSDEAEAVREAARADATIDLCSAEILSRGATGRLRWVQLMRAGVNACVPLPEVQDGKVLLTAMQGVASPVIADHAMALLLALTRALDVYLRDSERGRWDPLKLDAQRHYELNGRTMLVVGLGGIGTEVARRAHAFGMKIVATRASGRERPDFVSYVGLPDELLTLARDADVIVNCAPLTSATRGLFDAKFFAAAKPGAYFVNVGRGASVVTADLVAALESGRLAGVGLDVTDPEPLPADHPLWKRPNVVITPHVAGYSEAGFEKRWQLARENLRRYAAGEPLLQVVDPRRGY